MVPGSACLLVPVFSALAEAGTRSPKVEKNGASRPILSDFPLVLLDPNLLVVIRIMLKQSHEVAYAWVQGRRRQVLSPPTGQKILPTGTKLAGRGQGSGAFLTAQ